MYAKEERVEYVEGLRCGGYVFICDDLEGGIMRLALCDCDEALVSRAQATRLS